MLTNPGLGSLGSSITAQATQGAAHQASLAVGKQLTASPATAGANATTRLLLADPITVSTQVGHPIGQHSGLGLSAFYYTLLLVLAGFIGGNLIHTGVDTALGYADSEIGPWHTRRATVPIDRTQTLLLKMLMTAGITVLTTSMVMLACIAALGMDASHLPLLWIFSYCACLAIGLGVQAINAAFGGIGQLVSMFVFIALALPSSGATVPLQAAPPIYRFLGAFEPMRQLSGGVRAILYFGARGDAGLMRAWLMIIVGVAGALVFGFAMTLYYDRKGLRRLTPQPMVPQVGSPPLPTDTASALVRSLSENTVAPPERPSVTVDPVPKPPSPPRLVLSRLSSPVRLSRCLASPRRPEDPHAECGRCVCSAPRQPGADLDRRRVRGRRGGPAEPDADRDGPRHRQASRPRPGTA